MDDQLTIKSGIKETIPTVSGYLGIGIAFGIVAHSAGINTLLIFLMSAITYAGSAQFVIVGMLASKSPMLSIIFSAFLVNSRMILMSMTVAPYLKKNSMLKNILVGTLLTDESFALSMNKLNYTDHKLNFEWVNTTNVVSYLTWIVASVIGGLVGSLIPDPYKFGLDFAILAMFIGLLYMQIAADRTIDRRLQLLVIGFTFIAMYVGLIFIPSNLVVVIVTILGCGFGVLMQHVFF